MSQKTATPLFAHSRDGQATTEFEPLLSIDCPNFYTDSTEDCAACNELHPDHGHLNKVAYLAGQFAEALFTSETTESASAKMWGQTAGWWHDLGKSAEKWQDYLRAACDPHQGEISGKVDHSTAGAQFADKNIASLGRLLAYTIAGHHAGLANGIDDTDSSLEKRLQKQIACYANAPEDLLSITKELKPLPLFSNSASIAFFTRMIFSTLVDADFLSTEAYMSPHQVGLRQGNNDKPSIGAIEQALDKHLSQFGSPTTEVNQRRADILADCLRAAEKPPGLFSLTVPTGGGKTLSSLAFALKHARLHKLQRVIYVIPFTSIIEQNADVFRQALASLGDDVVIEHHSGIDPDAEHQTTRSRLIAENWDASLIVTTNVQFFESLHSNKPSRCRKLHNIARSVVILDEAQSLPTELLQPSLKVIEELTTNYQTSVVLCTATQPAIMKTEEFPIGLSQSTEMVTDPKSLYLQLRRVKTKYLPEPMDNETLVERLQSHDQVLCIVNTRRHAREVYDLLCKAGHVFHLSALMCPEHRREVLKTVKQRLHDGLPTRLISTQLIEAGVDIDLPVVYRSLAGLDSIAQAAGRCDREGKLSAHAGAPGGQLFIFNPLEPPPKGHLRSTADSAREVLATHAADPLSLQAIEAYFHTHYWKHSSQCGQHIQDCWPKLAGCPESLTCDEWLKREFLGFRFKDCAEKFKLIDDYSSPVIIPYGDLGKARCDELAATFDPAALRKLARRLQRYTVTIPVNQHNQLRQAGTIKSLHDDVFFVLNSSVHYSDEFGLHPKPDIIFDGCH